MEITNNFESISDSQSYSFHLSLSLIKHFRGFQQNNHNYLDKYIETTFELIEDFKLKNPDFLNLREYLKKFCPEVSLELIIIGIHFFFGSIANFESFLQILNNNVIFPNITKSHANKTNILNPYTINSQIAIIYQRNKALKVIYNWFY